MVVRVGVIGTSWWADAMYLPALASHPVGKVTAVCGRDPDRAAAFAARWGVDQWFTDPHRMLTESALDAVIVSTANDSHRDLALAAVESGLHVLCEKPLALNSEHAVEMARAARRRGAITMVPFTYHYMPVNRWVKQLIDDGFVGNVRHVNLRYYTGYAADPGYAWRFDRALAGSGVIGDLGSHWIHLARWLLDQREVSVGALASSFVSRESPPDGRDYERTEDSAVLTVRYESGAYGILQVSAVCWEGGPFGQSHHLEVHGDAGTIHATCDWIDVQEVRGLRVGEDGPPRVLPVPDELWKGVRRAPVGDTYRDVFRATDAMTRGWVTAIAEGRTVRPDFDDGLAVQLVVDAAVASAAADGRHIAIAATNDRR